MKTIYTFLLFCLIAQLSQAQTYLNFRSGQFIWGSGDLWVPTAEVEVRTNILDYLDIGASFGFGHYSSLSNEDLLSSPAYTHSSVFSDQTIGLRLLDSRYVGLKMVAGTSIRYFNQLLLFPYFREQDLNDGEGQFRSERKIVVGAIIRPEILLYLTEKDHIVLGVSTTPYTQSEISSGFSLSYMRKI